ncbi:MAG TPA: TolC family protein [bacterium]|nr:TolC family protein [bacterium]
MSARLKLINISLILLSMARISASFAQVDQEVQVLLERQSGVEIPALLHTEGKGGKKTAFPIVIKSLDLDETIELALTNNAEIKASLAELGIARSNLQQAALVENPELSVTFGVQTESPHFLPSGSLTQNFLDFFLVDLRKKAAESELTEARLAAADRVLDFIFRVKVAYFTLQGAEQLRQSLSAIAEASRVSAGLAQKLHDAGNFNLLELNAHRLAAETAQIELAKAESETIRAREFLLGLIGLKPGEVEIKKLSRLPALPLSDPSLKDLEVLGIERRLDLQAAKQKIESLQKNLRLAERQFLSHIDFGISAEREDSGAPVIGPMISLPLPVSDRNQAQKSKLQAQTIQSRYLVSSVERRILTEVRTAHAQLLESRKIAKRYQTHVLPLLRKTLEETLLHYNFMLKSPFDLLQARREEIGANRAYVEALREYWTHYAELERAVGASLK